MIQNSKIVFFLKDATRNFYLVPEQRQTFSDFLGANYQQVMEIRECPVGRMTLCVTSDAEMEKCVKMRVCSFQIQKNSNMIVFYCSRLL